MRKTLLIIALLICVVLAAVVPMVVMAQTTLAAGCPGAPAPRLSAGMTARPAQVYSTIWASPYDTAVIAVSYRANGDTFQVTSGPQCAIGPYNWYQVNYRGVAGWVTEGTGGVYWVEQATGSVATPTTVVVTPAPVTPVASATPRPPVTPAPGTGCPGAPVARLTAGVTARPAQVYSTLWQSPNNTAIITVMYKAYGDTFQVISGPSCAHGPYNWYQVNFKGTVGWVTEGSGSVYWVEAVGPAPTPTLVPTPTQATS